jgi:Ca2+-binding RTX toxin-like protein
MGHKLGVSVERLESRVLMRVDVDLSQKGKLRIIAPEGDTAGDVIELTLANGRRNVQVWVNGVLIDPTPRGGAPNSVRRSRIRRIVADLGAGDDTIVVGRRLTEPRVFRNKLLVRCTIVPGDGNDFVEAGPLDDMLIGGAGNDTIFGGRGDDVLFGGTGDDQLFGETGRDNLYGQDGNDYLDGDGNQDALYGMAGADHCVGGEDKDFVNPGNDPGDVLDHNDLPESGQTSDVETYVSKLIQLGVPDKYRGAAKS